MIIDDDIYPLKIVDLIRDAEKTYTKTLFVSLNKPYKKVREMMAEHDIDASKFFFIDTITSSVVNPEFEEDCLFMPTPANLNIFYADIISTMKFKGVQMIIFDSLSSLTIYRNSEDVEPFMTRLVAAFDILDCSALITCLKSDESTQLAQHMKMKVDKAYELQ